ncbi:MAG: hypothetical protein LBF83_10305 [Spirochaetaceae bacterium]|jgi:hypothetical protein|nr:hypothetical protein [Spirochaetaceae bacterium]
MKASHYLSLSIAFVLSAASCKSISVLVDGAGRVLDGSAFAEKTVKTYISSDKNISFRLLSTKSGKQQTVFTLNSMPFIQFYGDTPDETGRFFITRVHFLYSNADGWLEGDVNASGKGIIVETATTSGGRAAEFSLEGPVTLAEITRGGIKRQGRRLYGSRALTELRNREERIHLVTDWMKDRSPPALPVTQKDFESYWQPILLPETVSKKLRPSGYVGPNEAQTGGYSYGEGVKWNTAYTRELFPEYLRDLRDSGSLLRDWEEASAWFYVKYYWAAITIELHKKHYLK